MPRKTAFTNGFSSGFGPAYKRGTVIVKVGTNGPDPGWQDGDIICALNWHRTRCVHVEHICHPQHMTGGKGVRRPLNMIGRLAFLENVKEFRFDVLNSTQVKRTTLDGGLEEVLPMGTTEYITRRLQHERHMIFGVEGSEVFYGGKTLSTDANLDTAWDVVEANTGNREEQFDFWPCGALDLQHHLVLNATDFRDTDRGDFEEQDTDDTDPDNPIMVKRRLRKFEWQQVNGMSAAQIAQVQDRSVPVDIRDRKHPPKLYTGLKT